METQYAMFGGYWLVFRKISYLAEYDNETARNLTWYRNPDGTIFVTANR